MADIAQQQAAQAAAVVQAQAPQAVAPQAGVGAFASYTQFREAFEMARYLSASSLVPQQFQGQPHVGDCLIALEMAQRIGASPLAVMQSLYVVHGRPAWSAAFLVACLNATGRFSPLRFRMVGEAGQDSRGCVAWAVDRADGERLEGPAVTIALARAEGWYARSGSKWQTMPEIMLRYRAATLFVRLYAPEVSLGMQTGEELEDIGPRQPINVTPSPLPPQSAQDAQGGAAERAETADAASMPPPAERPAKRRKTASAADAQAETSTSGEQPLAALCHANGVTLEDVKAFFGRIGQAWDEGVVRANIGRIAADMRAQAQEDDAL